MLTLEFYISGNPINLEFSCDVQLKLNYNRMAGRPISTNKTCVKVLRKSFN